MMTPGRWRKSSRSQGAGNNCVEARLFEDQPQLSDSQHGGIRPIMDVPVRDYLGLIATIRNGRD